MFCLAALLHAFCFTQPLPDKSAKPTTKSNGFRQNSTGSVAWTCFTMFELQDRIQITMMYLCVAMHRYRYASLSLYKFFVLYNVKICQMNQICIKMRSTSSPSALSSFSSSCTSRVAGEAAVRCCQLKQKDTWDSKCIRVLCLPLAAASSWMWSPITAISNMF